MSLLRVKTILRRSSFSFIPVAPSRHTFIMTTNAQAAISHNSIDGLPSGFISGSRTIASSAPLAKSGGGAIPAITPTEPDRRYESPDPRTPTVYCFFEKATSTWQYIVADEQTSEAVIIDPVLDYDPASGGISTKTADGLVAFVTHHGLRISHILETHAHADHLTSSQYLKSQLGGNVPVCIGARIAQVQNTFASVYGFDSPAFFQNTFDIYFEDDFEFALGGTTCRVMHLPGHTPDHIGYVLGGAIFTGDSIFNPDVGSARADFPGGSVTDLYSSIQRLLSFPEHSLLFVGHDYPAPGSRTPIPCTTVREQKDAWNKKDKTEFIKWRQQRDATLSAPRLLHPSLQVNIRAGKLPLKDESGRAWLKTPLRGVDRCWPNCAY